MGMTALRAIAGVMIAILLGIPFALAQEASEQSVEVGSSASTDVNIDINATAEAGRPPSRRHREGDFRAPL